MFHSQFEHWMWFMVIINGFVNPEDLLDFGNMLLSGGEL